MSLDQTMHCLSGMINDLNIKGKRKSGGCSWWLDRERGKMEGKIVWAYSQLHSSIDRAQIWAALAFLVFIFNLFLLCTTQFSKKLKDLLDSF